MPGVATSPIGSGSGEPANCQASPPSASFTSFGALSWYFFGSHVSQMSVGSRMWQSASTISNRLMLATLRLRLYHPLQCGAVEFLHRREGEGVDDHDSVREL